MTKKSNFNFSFSNNTLSIIARQDSSEILDFNIVSIKDVTINSIVHTIYTSDAGDEFSIVNNEFHREDDLPAVKCIRLDLLKEEYVVCHMWFKHGSYHRDNDKPAVIYADGILMWFINGFISREPLGNMSVYIKELDFGLYYTDLDRKDIIFLEKEVLDQQIEDGLVNYAI